MKKTFILSFALGMAVATGFASSAVSPAAVPASAVSAAVLASASVPASAGSEAPAPTVKATEMRIPVGSTGKFINLQELATIKVADFEKLTGRKMGLFGRLEFKLAQKQIRHSIDKDGMVTNKKLARLSPDYGDEDGSFHIGGYALGFFLGLIGIIIAYVIKDDNHHRRVKWAWFGFGTYLILLGVLIAASA